jgi:GT2 family glycosyltransferase
VSTVTSTAPFSLSYLRQSNKSANAARNRAVEISRGEILLFLNDDTLAETDLLSQHIRTHGEYLDDSTAVLGRVTISPLVPPSIFAKRHLDASFGLWKNQIILDWRAFYTCNISVKRKFLLAYGLFDEELRYHDDVELGERLSHYGLKIIYNSKALGYHYHYLDEQEYLRLAQHEGRQLAVWYRKSPHLKTELASAGIYVKAPFLKRLRCILGDLIVNQLTIPGFLRIARFLAGRNESSALFIYNKISQSLKRRAIRRELSTG